MGSKQGMQIENKGEKVNGFFSQEETNKVIDVIKNPFTQDKITRIDLHYNRVTVFSEDHIYNTGSVTFKNGNTEGTQKFEADSFPELIRLVFEFCKNV